MYRAHPWSTERRGFSVYNKLPADHSSQLRSDCLRVMMDTRGWKTLTTCGERSAGVRAGRAGNQPDSLRRAPGAGIRADPGPSPASLSPTFPAGGLC